MNKLGKKNPTKLHKYWTKYYEKESYCGNIL